MNIKTTVFLLIGFFSSSVCVAQMTPSFVATESSMGAASDNKTIKPKSDDKKLQEDIEKLAAQMVEKAASLEEQGTFSAHREAVDLVYGASQIVRDFDLEKNFVYVEKLASYLLNGGMWYKSPFFLEGAIKINQGIIDADEVAVMSQIKARMNLGTALIGLGNIESRPDLIEKAVLVYEEGFKKTDKVMPEIAQEFNYKKIKTENYLRQFREDIRTNPKTYLYLSLQRRADDLARLDSKDDLVEAVKLYAQAVDLKLEKKPGQVREALFRLGVALWNLYYTYKDISYKGMFIPVLTEYLKKADPKSETHHYEVANYILGLYYGNEGIAAASAETGTQNLEQSVQYFRQSFVDQAQDEYLLAVRRYNFARALLHLCEKTGQKHLTAEAIAVLRDALKHVAKERSIQQWAGVNEELGRALILLGVFENNSSHFAEAKPYLESASLAWDECGCASERHLQPLLDELGKKHEPSKFNRSIILSKEPM